MDRYACLDHVARRQHGCWTTTQAVACGFPPQTIDSLVERGAWRREHLGVLSAAGTPVTWEFRLTAAWLFLGSSHAVVGRRAAARLWRLPGFDRTSETAFVVPRGHTPRLRGVPVSRTIHLPDSDVAVHRGFRVTTATRTLHDLARVVPARILLPAAAEAYRVGRTDPWRLLDSVRARPGLAGNRRLREVIARLDPRMPAARSVAEIVANVRLRDLGFTDFRVNVGLVLSCGRRVEVDLLFPGRRVLEVNGARYHGTVVQRAADAERRSALERDGYIVRELWAGELHHPSRVRDVVEELLHTSVSSSA